MTRLSDIAARMPPTFPRFSYPAHQQAIREAAEREAETIRFAAVIASLSGASLHTALAEVKRRAPIMGDVAAMESVYDDVVKGRIQ